MALSVIYPSSASVYTRVIDTTGLSELHIDYGPAVVLVMTGSYPVTSSITFITAIDTGSIYPITASYALTSATATNILENQLFS